MEKILIDTEFIRLQELLKLSSVASTGGAAKIHIQAGEVFVNGEVCLQRGKKLRAGDIVSFENKEYEVVNAN